MPARGPISGTIEERPRSRSRETTTNRPPQRCSKRTAAASPAAEARSRSAERPVDDFLRLAQERFEMRFAAKALGIDLVERLGAGGTCREPRIGRNHLDAAKWRV